jgi:hypothetical protein
MALRDLIVKVNRSAVSFLQTTKTRSEVVADFVGAAEELAANTDDKGNGSFIPDKALEGYEGWDGKRIRNNGLASVLTTPAMVAGRGLIFTVKRGEVDGVAGSFVGVRKATADEKAAAEAKKADIAAKARAKKG